MELKARFDEESNIEWAKALERAGVHVVYGLLGLKSHCKVAIIVRREGERIRRYVHLATGNYNAVTAHLYTDIGMFTGDEDIASRRHRSVQLSDRIFDSRSTTGSCSSHRSPCAAGWSAWSNVRSSTRKRVATGASSSR